MSVKLVFSFDSEEYETPAADDAEKWWAEAMSRHGITACACVVGELARALRKRGRRDVIEAMARHEIAYHSDLHSAHPTWAVSLDEMSWEQGVARVLREEARGIADVAETFGQYPSAWCKPGASWGPQVAHAMARMGITVFTDSPFTQNHGQPLWLDECLMLTYDLAFDSYFNAPRPARLERMKADFLAARDRQEGGYLIMYTHPCRLVTTRFTRTFTGGKNPPRSQWAPSPLRPDEEIRALQEDFDAFLAWVIKQRGVELTTYRALQERYRQPAAPWLSAEDVRQLSAVARELSFLWVDSTCLSPAEQFGALSWAVAALAETGRLPAATPVRRLLGPTAPPPEGSTPESVPWGEFAAAAQWVDAFCARARAVPAAIPVANGSVGPDTFLQAAAALLAPADAGGTPPERVPLRPGRAYPAITERADFRELRFRRTWSEFPEGFEGRKVLEMIRLQAWTAKPAIARG